MPEEHDHERLESTIRARYPYPLAATFSRAYYQAPEPVLALDYLMNLYEVTLKYLTAILLAQYFHDELDDPQVNRSLLALQRPSLGHWQGWLRDILELYGRAKRPLLVPELAAFYRQKHSGAIAAAFNALRAIRDPGAPPGNRSVVSTQQFFDELGAFRNQRAHRPMRAGDLERAGAVLAPAWRELFQALAFLADYRLIYVREVVVSRDPRQPSRRQYGHRLTYLLGDLPRAQNNLQTTEDEPLNDRELYLLNSGEFKPLLSLHPFWIFHSSDSAAREEAFVLNLSSGSELEYISYQSGDRFNPTEYVDYMRSLLQQLKLNTPAEGAPSESTAERSDPRPAESGPAQPGEATMATPAQETVALPPPVERPAARAARRSSMVYLVGGALVLLLLIVGYVGLQAIAAPGAPITLPYTISGHSGAVSSLAFSPDGQILASGSADKSIRLWRVGSGALLRAIADESNAPVNSVAFAPDGKTVASGLAQGQVKLWRVDDGALVRSIDGHNGQVHSVAFAPDAETLASGAADNTIKLWRVSDGTLLRTLARHSDAVLSVAFSPGGQSVASGSADKTMQLWGSTYGIPQRTFATHSGAVSSLAFSPDGQILASGSADAAIILWRVSDGEELRRLAGHNGAVAGVAFAPDGQTLASASADNTIKLWRVADGELLSTLTGHAGGVGSVAISPDGRILASGSADQTIRLWPLR